MILSFSHRVLHLFLVPSLRTFFSSRFNAAILVARLGLGLGLALPAQAVLGVPQQSLTGSTRVSSSAWLIVMDTPADSVRGAILQKQIASQFGSDAILDPIDSTRGELQLDFNRSVSESELRRKLGQIRGIQSIAPALNYAPQMFWSVRKPKSTDGVLQGRDGLLSRAGDWVRKHILGYERMKRKSHPEVLPPMNDKTLQADPESVKDWAMAFIRVPEISRPQHPVTAAVLDTGVDYNHEDLRDAMWRDPSDSKVVGYDFVHGSARPMDVVEFDRVAALRCMNNWACRHDRVMQNALMSNPGHGTHCAGHIGAVAENGRGIRAPGATTKIMALKVFQEVGDPNPQVSNTKAIVRAIDYAIAKGARVINMSMGGEAPEKNAETVSPVKAALKRARDAGVLVVIAAGNEGADQETAKLRTYPGAYSRTLDNVITVAAVSSDGVLSDFSNYGVNTVHIAAPGEFVLSTTSGGGYSSIMDAFIDVDGEIQVIGWDGTSFAAPLVTGAVARIWAEHPWLNYKQVKQAILEGARPLEALRGKIATGGVLDVESALQVADRLATR